MVVPKRYDFTRADQPVIACFDIDCFYAQCLSLQDESLQGKAFAVRQKYLLVTSSYEARALGVKKMMMVKDALKVCPKLIIRDGSDLTPFRAASEKINDLWESYGCPVERGGLDESFVDITRIVEQRLREEDGVPAVSQTGTGWPDSFVEVNRRLVIGDQIVKEMRKELFQRLGFKCCGGTSISKLCSKLASEMHKPNQQSVLFAHEIPSVVADMRLRVIRGIGRSITKQLFQLYEQTQPMRDEVQDKYDLKCKHILPLTYDQLVRHFRSSKTGTLVYELVRGVDQSEVVNSGLMKQISQEETSLPHPETAESALDRVNILCERLMVFANERKRKDQSVPTVCRIQITDKGDRIQCARSERLHYTKQTKLLPGSLDSATNLSQVAQKLLREILPTHPFRLCRINIALLQFEKTQILNKMSSIGNFFDTKKSESGTSSTSSTTTTTPTKHDTSKVPLRLANGEEVDHQVFESLPKEIQEELIQQLEHDRQPKPKKRKIDQFFGKQKQQK